MQFFKERKLNFFPLKKHRTWLTTYNKILYHNSLNRNQGLMNELHNTIRPLNFLKETWNYVALHDRQNWKGLVLWNWNIFITEFPIWLRYIVLNSRSVVRYKIYNLRYPLKFRQLCIILRVHFDESIKHFCRMFVFLHQRHRFLTDSLF